MEQFENIIETSINELKVKVLTTTNFESVYKDVSKLDRLGYEGFGELLTKDWYFARYNGNSVVKVVYLNEYAIAYLMIVGITKDAFQALASGVLDGDINIRQDKFTSLDSKYVYVTSVVVHPSYRERGIATWLIKNIDVRYATNKNIIALVDKQVASICEKDDLGVRLNVYYYRGKYAVVIGNNYDV